MPDADATAEPRDDGAPEGRAVGVEGRVAEFLAACRHEQADRAVSLLRAAPTLVRESMLVAAAAGDADAVASWLATDPSSATRPSLPDDTAPLICAVTAEPKRSLGVSEAVQADIVRSLIDAGASANASIPLEGADGRIPALYFPAVSNNLPVARVLLEHGANPNDGESVYHAAQHNHRDMLALLLSFGGDPSGNEGAHGNTPLYFLATHRVTNPISALCMLGMEWLLDHGADPNVPSHISPSGKPVTSASETPLQRAAASGYDARVMQLLVDHGARVDAARADGRTAYALAVRSGNVSAAAYLASVGGDIAPLAAVDRLLGACATGDEDGARAIVAAHPDVMSSLDDEARATLGVRVAEGNAPVVALMLSLGWPLDQEGEWGGTALHWAAWNGRAEMVRQLIAAGAPVNVRDSAYGSSPIAWAAHGSTYCEPRDDADYVTIVHALLDAGASREHAINRWSEAPAGMARADVAQALRDRGFLDPSP